MAYEGDNTSFELRTLGLLEEILKELRKMNVYNSEAQDFWVEDSDVEGNG